MTHGDLVTVWVGGQTEFGHLVRGWIFDDGSATHPTISAKPFRKHMDERVKNGLSRLYEWESERGGVRLIDEADRGVVWLPGWSEEIDRALLAARALM